MPDVNLAFLARQMERLIERQARLQDDMTVVMARLERVETQRRDRCRAA
jgi:hypothetical protein